MIEHIIYKFKSKVHFYAKGADIEGFLSWCIRNNIGIEKPVKKKYIMEAYTSPENYRKLRYPAKKYGIKMRIIKKEGIYYFGKRNLIKSGFFFGIIFAVLFCITMNRFIWVISVEGNSNISSDKIISSAEKMGLVTGTAAKKHMVQDIEWFILNENNELSDVQINIQGSVAEIKVNEREEDPVMKSDDDMPVNLVASTYGVIRKAEVFDGQSRVKAGDAVMKGDLLVSAVFEDRHNKLTLKHARANIVAETDHSAKIEFPMEQILYEKGKHIKNIYSFEIFGYDFKTGKDEKYKNFNAESVFKEFDFFGIKVPIKLIITRYSDVKANSITYTFEEAGKRAERLLKQYEKNEMSEMEILSRKITESIESGKYIIKADYIVLMNIAVEQPIESDIPWENTDDMS